MEFVRLKTFMNYIDANIVLGRLKNEGIDCWLRNENTSTIMPIWNTAIGGIQLMVSSAQAEKASYILRMMEEEKREQISCPSCGGSNVEYINTVRKPVNWVSAAVTFLLGDLALMPEQRYHCFDCGKEWKAAQNSSGD
jgi:DNA-directed RNA polymerase subunit RPC12/RpoP